MSSPLIPGTVRSNVMVPARDGVRLATDVFLPHAAHDGPVPVLLCRTPYGKQRVLGHGRMLRAGYAVAVQDCRGRHDSEGSFEPIFCEGRDGYDTVEWLAAQDWCDGNVGTFGGSYPGWTQWALARERPPHLGAMAPSVTAGRWMRQEMYHDGCVFLGALNWYALVSGRVLQQTWLGDWRTAFRHLPLREVPSHLARDLPYFSQWLDHTSLDDYWKRVAYDEDVFASIDVPVLHLGGWFDGNVYATVFFYEGMVRHSPARDRQSLVLGPWDHGGAGSEKPPAEYGALKLPEESSLDLGAMRLAFFDRWLRGGETGPVAEARSYTTGANRWRTTARWPVDGEPVRWHLRGAGRANTVEGDGVLSGDAPGDEPADVYRYDPDDPVVLMSTWDFYGPMTNPALPVEPPPPLRDSLEMRPDALVYTSAPLAAPVEVTGRPVVELFAATDGPDTDFFAWIIDVDEDGATFMVSRGQRRGRFRESLEREVLLEPGSVYRFDLDCKPLQHEFAAGHRIRLVVSSSLFPNYDRNLNTGGSIADGTEMRVATNTVFHDAARPSALVMKVVGGGA